MPSIRHIWQPIQFGDYAISIDLKDAYFQNTIAQDHHFLQFVWQNMLHQ